TAEEAPNDSLLDRLNPEALRAQLATLPLSLSALPQMVEPLTQPGWAGFSLQQVFAARPQEVAPRVAPIQLTGWPAPKLSTLEQSLLGESHGSTARAGALPPLVAPAAQSQVPPQKTELVVKKSSPLLITALGLFTLLISVGALYQLGLLDGILSAKTSRPARSARRFVPQRAPREIPREIPRETPPKVTPETGPMALPKDRVGAAAAVIANEDADEEILLEVEEEEGAGPAAPASPPAPAAFSFQLTSIPPGALVRLNGKAIGQSPLQVTLAPDEEMAKLELRKRGYQVKRFEIPTAEFRSESLEVRLQARPRRKSPPQKRRPSRGKIRDPFAD
ncbi:MAG: PEGA domain-containing protein, partial [Myxococcota bacterium]|nr:PEGA domain-containing protein [Myxococcota bacterium]